MHRCPPPETLGWPSPGVPVVFPASARLAVSGLQIRLQGRVLACGFLYRSRPPRSCQPLAAAGRVKAREATRVSGLALSRRPRPRPSCSEEDGPRDPLATRSTARAMALQTRRSSGWSIGPWPAITLARPIRRRHRIPRISHAAWRQTTPNKVACH
jgi:hypothetical protein